MDDDEYDRIVDPDGAPPWIGLLSLQQRAWRSNEILRGRNPDPYIEAQLKKARKWPPRTRKPKGPSS